MRADQAYDELMRRVREESLLTTIDALLEWDEETYMPAGGVENRSVATREAASYSTTASRPETSASSPLPKTPSPFAT